MDFVEVTYERGLRKAETLKGGRMINAAVVVEDGSVLTDPSVSNALKDVHSSPVN